MVKKIRTIIENEPNPRNTLVVWNNSIENVGQEFKDVEILRLIICNFCIANYKNFIFVKNDHQRMTVECAYKEYGWRLHASCFRNQDIFAIKILNNEHTCRVGLKVRSHSKASKHLVLNIVKKKI